MYQITIALAIELFIILIFVSKPYKCYQAMGRPE